MQFLYADGEHWHFMNPESFEQVQSDKAGMGGAEKWLKGEEQCVVTLWNGSPIMVTPPNFVELKITETDPGVRGDTSGGGGKPAKLETGATVTWDFHDFPGAEVRGILHQGQRSRLGKHGTRADGQNFVVGFEHIAAAADDESFFFVHHHEHGF